jgi:ABC-2 type transport system ATP-binding protein
VSDVVLRVEQLAKTFTKPFDVLRPFKIQRVEAVRDVSFEVSRGEIFGFLGPNGAGKTTTIKMLTGLIAPTRGRAFILGHEAPSPEAMARVGFLPENPYVYPYLTPREFVSLCARLSGVPGRALAARVEAVIARVGMAYAIDRAVRALSKGMLQRVGLAAALVHEPELLVLDEPMSGLDPVGRKEVRDLIVEEKRAGRTVFFSSHILSDVEMLCDRVCILRKGEVVVKGAIGELLGGGKKRRSEVHLGGASDALFAWLSEQGFGPSRIGEVLVVEADGEESLRAIVERALASGARLESVTQSKDTLEDLFVRQAI